MAEPSSVEGFLDPAWQMRWRVPELALVLSDRAVAFARRTGDRGARLRAESLALFAANRLGRGVASTGRALAAVREAEASGGDVLTRLRIELGWCAVHAGSHEVAVRILRRELAQDRIEPTLRAHALLALASALPAQQDVDERSQVLDEAERLYADCDDDQDLTRVLKARVWVIRAAHCRRLGEFGEAVSATDAGLGLLRRLSDPEAEAGEIQTRLLLERVHALLDQGHRVEAVETSQAVLAEPVRAAAAGPTGWLGLALATRVHLPAGDHGAALRVLAETAAISERHKLDGLLAEALNALSRAHERVEEISDALQALRGAYSADRRWRSAVHSARVGLLSAYPAEVPRSPRASVVAAVPEPAAAEPVAPTPVPTTPEPAAPVTAVPTTPERAAPVTAEPATPEPAAPAAAEAAAAEPVAPEPVTIEPAVAGPAAAEHAAPEPAAEPLVPEPEPEPEPATAGPVATAPDEPAEPASTGRGGYAEAHDAARLLMEALTKRAAEEAEEPAAAPVDEAPAGRRAVPEPRVAFDSASPSEMFSGGQQPQAPEPQSSAGAWWPSRETPSPAADERAAEVVASDHEPADPSSDPSSGRYGTAGQDYGDQDYESGGHVDAYGDDDPSQRWSGDPLAAAADSLRRITEAHDRRGHAQHPDPEPVTPPQGFPAVEPQDSTAQAAHDVPEESGGRRSKGKSLAEIRADLQLPADHQPSRRRSRHADPDPLAAFQPAQPEPEPPARSAEDTDPSFRFSAPEPSPEPAPPEPSPDASLADLLADALMAYNEGRTDEAKQQVSEGIAAVGYGGHHNSGYGEPGYGDSHSDSDSEHTDDDAVGGTGRNRRQSTEDDQLGARHRAPGFGGAAADPLL
ncbi:ATP-binding protein [Saccharopolyspora tripterygii]